MSGTHFVRLLVVGCWCGSALGQSLADSVVATVSTPSPLVQPGEPVWVNFSIANITDQPVELIVPGVAALPSTGVVSLPLSHVFGGSSVSALRVQSSQGRSWEAPVRYLPASSAETLVLGPHASVGVRVEMAQHYRVLHSSGLYSLQWAPYGGVVRSNRLAIRVDTRKQAVIQTDSGIMTVRFFYEDAPNHVRNFTELARSGFYDNLSFHHLIPGVYAQGGCPNGDGAGIRPDGIKLKAELSDHPMKRGSFCMARLEDDLDSASCQFFICNTRVPQWDGRYTIFGELVGEESFTTLDKLMAASVSPEGRPKRKIHIRAIRIVEESTFDRTSRLAPMAAP